MRTAQEITNLVNSNVADGIMPHLDTPEKIAAYIQHKINVEAKDYLAATDWYVVRFLETSEAIPLEVTALRAAARSAVL